MNTAREVIFYHKTHGLSLHIHGLADLFLNNNNNNNNNNYDYVYGAIIMTKVIARVHPVHLMNAD